MRRADLELLGGVIHDHPAERIGPPPPERGRFLGSHDDLLPLQAHQANHTPQPGQGHRR